MPRWLTLALLVTPLWADGVIVLPHQVAGTATEPMAGTGAESAQTAWVDWADGVERLTVAIDYHGPAESLCWLLPVPGTPAGDDLSLGDAAELTAVFARTARREWLIGEPRFSRLGPLSFADFCPAVAPVKGALHGTGTALPAEARLATQVQLGRYELSVLTARTGAGLNAWLAGAGFAVPPGLAPVADEYLQRGWSFVAARVPAEHAADPGAWPPLCVRFAAPRPVFPLRISSLGAAPRTLLRLVVTTPAPIKVATPGLDDRDQYKLGPAAVADGKELAAAAQCWVARGAQPRCDTRYQVVFTPATMVDLEWAVGGHDAHFIAHDPARPPSGGDTRWAHFYVEPPTWANVTLGPVGMMLLWWGLTVLGLAVRARWGLGRCLAGATVTVAPLLAVCQVLAVGSSILSLLAFAVWPVLLLGLAAGLAVAKSSDRGARSRTGAFVWAAALLGLAVVACLHALGSSLGGMYAALAVPSAVALPLAVVEGLLARAERAPEPTEPGGSEHLATLLAVVVAAGGVAVLVGACLAPDDRWQSLAPPLVLAVVGGWVLLAPSREPRARATALMAARGGLRLTLLVATGLLAAAPRLEPALARVPARYAAARHELLAALARCEADTGVLPASLKDLTATEAPTAGVDAAGNPVPLRGAWHGPYLARVPANPLRGRVAWRYEPTGELLVWSED